MELLWQYQSGIISGMSNGKNENHHPAREFLRRRDQWIRWVIEGEMSLLAKVVGVHLAMRMSARNQVAWPNIKTIAKMLSRSPRQITRAITELEEERALYVVRTEGKGNAYYLRLPTDP